MTKSYLRILKIAVLASLLLPFVISINSLVLKGTNSLSVLLLKLIIFMPIAGLVFWIINRVLNRNANFINNLGRQQAKYLEKINIKKIDAAIFLSAGISLFLELSVIRWQGAIFPVFAFYKNYSLLACFMGLGLGYALAKRDSIPLFFSISVLAFQMLLLTLLRYSLGSSRITSLLLATPFTEQLDMGLKVSKSIPHFVAIYSFLIVVFMLTSLTFIPVGQICGKLMGRRKNLRAYGFNLLGSIAGVVLVIGISFLWTPPVIWFCIIFILILGFQAFNPKLLFIGIISALISIIILTWPVSVGYEKIYSPYQLLERGPGVRGLSMIRAAGHFYQRVYDLSVPIDDPAVERALRHYELPYRIFGKKPGDVAIMGSGMGNDVAAAIRHGAEKVDAIEIDPAIWKLGKLYHPEKPYDNPKVNSIINDARTFFRMTENKYNMIVYGLLDSHTLLSYASSIRLDSYVYTVEGFREARARLKKNGLLSLSFYVISPELGRKIFLMMQEAFKGKKPVCIQVNYGLRIIFLQNKEGTLRLDRSILKKFGYTDVTSVYNDPGLKADISTDDWPFFYMPNRVYPKSYLGVLALIIILSIFITYNFVKHKLVFSNLSFFFLGAGFMLVETKAITEMGLAFGNT